MKTIKPCTLGKRHTWTYSHNYIQHRHIGPRVSKLSLRGVYHCACGAKKFGEAR